MDARTLQRGIQGGARLSFVAQRRRRLRTWGGAALALLAVGCSSGGTPGAGFDADSGVTVHVHNEVGEPVQLRYVYAGAVPTTLGQVAANGRETFTFRYLQGFDLRLTADFVERRTSSSNPIMDLRPGDVLDLTINQRKELELAQARTR